MKPIIKKKMISLLRRFRAEEIPDILEDMFNKLLDWETVKQTCVKLKLNLANMKDLADICVHVFENLKPSNDDVQYALWHLEFFATLRHNRYKWNGAILRNEEDNFPENLEQLQEKILQAYRMEARGAKVISKLEDDIVFVMIVEVIVTKRGIRHGKPFFAAFNVALDKKYIFFFPKKTEDSSGPDHLQLLGQALGFSSYKHRQFSGMDVRSMFRMVKKNMNPECKEVAVFRPTLVFQDGNIVDFTQGVSRMNYAIDVLPPGFTNLREFTVHSTGKYCGDLPVPSTCRITSQIRIRVKSPNHSIEDVFRELIAMNTMVVPVPQYVSQFPGLTKNIIRIQDRDELTEGEDHEGTTWDKYSSHSLSESQDKLSDGTTS